MFSQPPVSEIALKRTTLPDADGYFQYSTYVVKQESTLVTEESKHFQLLSSRIKVPKNKAEEIQKRIYQQIENDRAALHKEDIFVKDAYFIPTEQKTSFLRNTQRNCVICGGPHSAGQCPLKKQQQMQNELPSSVQAQECTYSVRLEPLPQNWERREVFEFVAQAGSQLKEEHSKALEAFGNVSAKLKVEQDSREKMLLEHEQQQIKKVLDEKMLALNAFVPKRVAVIQDKKYSSVHFAFIHFSNEAAAQNFARIKQTTLLTVEQTYMHAAYQGEFKKK